MRNSKKTYTLEELKNAGGKALSKKEFGELLFGYVVHPNKLSKAVDDYTNKFGKPTHWLGWYRPRNSQKKKPNRIFFKTGVYASSKIRARILADKLMEYKCVQVDCPVEGKWLGKPLTLHLDHIDGDRKNNRLDNLRFLCPNCHQQTDTWGQKRGAKLPSDLEIKKLLNQGKKYKEIALIYEVHPSTVAHRMKRIKNAAN